MNQDYKDMLSALLDAGTEFLVVGAYALAAHGFPRATGDIDIWIRPTHENALRVWNALSAFGAQTSNLIPGDIEKPDVVYQIGVAPRRIDLLTSIPGVSFEEAWQSRVVVTLAGLAVPVIGREALVANKRAAGRMKDLADAELLEGDPG